MIWGHNRPDRLNHPLMHGKRVSWDALLDDLAQNIRTAMEKHGPDGFGFFAGSGSDPLGVGLMFGLGAAVGTRQVYTPLTMDVAPVYRAAEFVTGCSQELQPHWERDDEDVRLLLVFGSNPVVSHGYAGAAALSNVSRLWRALQDRGGKIWVFDPVYTRSARLADHHVAPLPGSDPIILAWLVRQTLEGLPSDSPVRRKTRAEDLDRLRTALAGFDLQTVSRLSGVEPALLEQLMEDIRRAGRLVAPAGTGVVFGPNGVVGEWLRWALLILTDSLEEPGGMWFDPGWMFKLDERQDWQPVAQNGAAASAPATRPDLPRHFGQTPLAALADEIEAGPLRTLLLFGAAPITCVPEPDRMARALRSLDALAAIDVVPSEVTELSTHIMPATGMLERSDLNGLLVQPYRPSLSTPVVPPVAERRHSWYMIAQLAKRLGVADQVLGGADPDDLTEETILRGQLANARHSYEELREAGPHGLMYDTRRKWALQTAIPGGKWRIAPQPLVERLGSLLPAGDDGDFPFMLICGRQERRHNRHDNVDRPKHREAPLLRISPADASRLTIAEGDLVRISSPNGDVRAHAAIKDNIRAGVVQLPHGWPDANVTRLLTNADVDPLTTQPQMTAFKVALEAIRPAVPKPADGLR
ncbi:MAG TPA: molybdopterin-dependent oxidoreductase [Novosphingobium sp.]|nr:molybdopterin-dependent oxidoreductase [Novosphingobium sp.]